jgi:hypothetical protein
MALSTRRLPSLLRGPGEPSSPALRGTTKALRLPIRASAVTYGFASAAHPIPPAFVFAAALPQGRRSLPGPGFERTGRPTFRLLSCGRVWDLSGLQTNQRVLAMSATSMLPPLCAQRRLRQLLFRGSLTQLRHPLTYASRFVLPLTRKARFRLAGWPLPGGRRTLWTATRGFSSC